MIKVSVLTAAYNAEKYIADCLDSLLSQSFSDFEVICVDDASTDKTPQILQEYSEKDHRVVYIRLNENGGQAKARNIALRRAKGEYICMLDADDWMSPDALQSAYDIFRIHPETDSVLFQVCEVYENKHRVYPMPDFQVLSGQEAFEKSLTWAIHGLYMVRASIHHCFPYDDSSKSYSDDNTTRMHYLQSREVRQCQGIYYYRQHHESVTHRISVRRFDYLRANESMRQQMIDAHVEKRLLKLYEKMRWLNLIDVYMFYYKNRRQLSQGDRQYGIDEMRRVWKSIDVKCLPNRLRWKFGYMPFHSSWFLFRLQEEIYFFLRSLIGKNR